MTEQFLNSMLIKLNKGQLIEQMFLRELKANLEFGFLWYEKPNPTMDIISDDGRTISMF